MTEVAGRKKIDAGRIWPPGPGFGHVCFTMSVHLRASDSIRCMFILNVDFKILKNQRIKLWKVRYSDQCFTAYVLCPHVQFYWALGPWFFVLVSAS